MSRWFTKFASRAAELAGHYVAFAAAVAVILIWAVLGPVFKFTDTWQLVINTGTTIVTFLMVFLIQHTQNRDSLATHLKLDEIIRSLESADNEIMNAEDQSDETLHELKQKYQSLCQQHEELKQQLEKIQSSNGQEQATATAQ